MRFGYLMLIFGLFVLSLYSCRKKEQSFPAALYTMRNWHQVTYQYDTLTKGYDTIKGADFSAKVENKDASHILFNGVVFYGNTGADQIVFVATGVAGHYYSYQMTYFIAKDSIVYIRRNTSGAILYQYTD
jgi:hypothetical protein